MTTFPNYGPQLPESYYADESLGRMDPSRQSEFPGFEDTLHMRPPAPQQTTPQGPQSPFGADMPRDLQSMIAPYRDMASKFSSPYLMMSKDSWLAQKHPGAAGVIDNALSAVALSKFGAPASAGQNLSAALGGALEARQMKRQQLMQQAMLPYHMMMPQIEAEEKMAQTQNYLSEIPYRQRMGERAEAQAEAQHRYFMPHPTGQTQVDTEGNRWQEITDPVSQTSRWKNPTTNKFADEYSPEQQPKFVPQHQAGGGTEAERIFAQKNQERALLGLPELSSDEKIKLINNMAGGRAAATTGGSEGVKGPIQDVEKFRDNELKNVQEPKVQSASEFLALNKWEDNVYGREKQAYDEYVAGQQAKIQTVRNQKAAYEASNVWKKGISFQDYQANPTAAHAAPTPQAKAKSTKSATREFNYNRDGSRQ